MSRNSIKIPAYGNSMYPFFLSGDILVIQPISLQKILINDFITFVQKNVFITHRVIYIPPHKKYILTKGDANRHPDKRVLPERIIGKVIKIQRGKKIYEPDNLYKLQSTLYRKEIKKINNLFRKNDINFVFLKGLPIHLFFQNKIPQRLYADCDVLIDKKDIPKSIILLKKKGYSIKDAKTTLPKSLQTYPPEFDMTKIINNMPITFDIHTQVCFMIKQFFKGVSPLYSEALLENLGQRFLKHKRFIMFEKAVVPILSQEDLILYCALHLFSHNFKGYHHYDTLKAALQKGKTDFSLLANIIHYFQLKNYVFPIFLLLKKYYDLNIPSKFIQNIKASQKTIHYIQHHILSISIFSDEGKLTRGEEKFRHMFFLSSHTLLRKTTIIFSPPILYSISWVMLKKIRQRFMALETFFYQYRNFSSLKEVKTTRETINKF